MNGEIRLCPSSGQPKPPNFLAYEEANIRCHSSSLDVLYRRHTLYRGQSVCILIPRDGEGTRVGRIQVRSLFQTSQVEWPLGGRDLPDPFPKELR
jgi:hypothetical protein